MDRTFPMVRDRTFPMVLEGSFPIASENRNTIFQCAGNDLTLLFYIFYSIRVTIQSKNSGKAGKTSLKEWEAFKAE